MASHPRFLPIVDTPERVLKDLCGLHQEEGEEGEKHCCSKVRPNLGAGSRFFCAKSYPDIPQPPEHLRPQIPCIGTQHLTCPGWLVLTKQQDAEQVA